MEHRRMDAEAGSGHHRSRCPGKLAVLVVVQNLLVIGCLLVTLRQSLFQTQTEQQKDTICIQVEDFNLHRGNTSLQFEQVKRSYRMELDDKNRDRIQVQCTGPYVWYMDVCYEKIPNSHGNGTLQLQAEGAAVPGGSLPLSCTLSACRGLHGIAYFKAGEKVRLQLSSTSGFMIRNVTMSLTYLLGIKCDY